MRYATDADEHHEAVPMLPPYSGQHWRPPAGPQPRQRRRRANELRQRSTGPRGATPPRSITHRPRGGRKPPGFRGR